MPRFSIIIPNYNGKHYLEDCLASLEACHYPKDKVECILVDNGSTDGSGDFVQVRFPNVLVVELGRNTGFVGGINAGVRVATGDYLIFLNNDMRVSPHWLSAFEAVLYGENADCATGKILSWNGRHIDFIEGLLLFDGHALQRYLDAKVENFLDLSPRRTFVACGGNMAIKRSLYNRLGGFDQDFFAYSEDVDFSWRLYAAGHSIYLAPEATVFHHHQGTSTALGVYNRGFLYEKNALMNLYKNIDSQYFSDLLHVAWITLVHRTKEIVALNTPGSEVFACNPYEDMVVPGSHRMTESMKDLGKNKVSCSFMEIIKRTLKYCSQKGFTTTLGRVMTRIGAKLEGSLVTDADENTSLINLGHPHIISQFQAIWYLMANMENLLQKRKQVQDLRKIPDLEIFREFPPWVVATYPGDMQLFGSACFLELLPREIPFRFASLSEVHGEP